MNQANTVIALLAAAGACLAAAPASAEPVVYEGSLSYLDAPVSSTADLRFRLFDAVQGGAQLGADVVIDAATLDKGAFEVTLDFGAFNSGWIEVAVRAPSGDGEFVTLTPRQRLDAAIINGADDDASANARGGAAEPGASLSLTHRAPRGPGLDPAGGGVDPSYSGGLGGFDNPGDDVGFNPAGPLWQLSGSNLYYTAGNIGVGTTTPSMPLHVVSNSAAQSILGVNSAANGRGITGLATGGGGVNFGVFGISFSPDGSGVFGQANTATGSNFGVTGLTDSTTGTGVRGLANAATGTATAVLGQVVSSNGWAGRFLGGTGVYSQNGVSIGTTETDAILRVAGSSSNTNIVRVQIDGSTKFYVNANGGVTIGAFVTPPVDGIYSGGAVGIGRSPAANSLEVNGNASKSIAGDWLANSDRRIKTEIETVTNALDTLDKVRLVSFEYTEEYKAEHSGIGDRRYLNVIAQEFAQVFPEHVQGSGEFLPDGSEILQVDTYPLTIYSAAAVQELRGVVNDQDARIAALESRDESICAELAELRETVQSMKTGDRPLGASLALPLVAAAGLGFLAVARTRKGRDK